VTHIRKAIILVDSAPAIVSWCGETTVQPDLYASVDESLWALRLNLGRVPCSACISALTQFLIAEGGV